MKQTFHRNEIKSRCKKKFNFDDITNFEMCIYVANDYAFMSTLEEIAFMSTLEVIHA